MAWILDTDLFKCDKDTDLGKVAKRRRLNPVGEDAYLCPVSGLVTLDEQKITELLKIGVNPSHMTSSSVVSPEVLLLSPVLRPLLIKETNHFSIISL